jgi:acyl-coenzyme A synthetase/AMP-(fatty) acid ligase
VTGTAVNATAETLRGILHEAPDADALLFESHWYPWGELARVADELEAALDDAGVARGAPVGIVLRNRPSGVAALLATLAAQRCAVMISPIQPAQAIADDVDRLQVAALIAEPQDWGAALLAAVQRAGTLGVELADDGTAIEVRVRPDAPFDKDRPRYAVDDDAAVIVPTSGTTGPPKRIPLSWDRLPLDPGPGPRVLRDGGPRPPTIHALPIVTITGLGGLLGAVSRGRSLALLERVDVVRWAALVKQYRPRRAGLPPAAMRSVLDAGIAPEDLASLEAWPTGSAPLDPALKDEFEATYGIPVLVAYGATEFGGGVAGWSLDDYQARGKEKRGSVGRASPGVELRVVDADGTPLRAGEEGILEVRSPRIPVPATTADGWVRTNDLVRIDEDGYLFIQGRADDVIIRGGFKVPLYEVEAVLAEHPSVHEAAAVGIADPRLGQVPAAAVVLEPGADVPTEEALIAWVHDRIAPYKVPVKVIVVDALPRTASLKVSRPLMRELLGGGHPA